jgi:recombinational DNA repair protein RecT
MDTKKFKETTSLDLTGFSEVNFLDTQDKRDLVKQIPVAIQFITTLMKIHRISQEEAETIFSKESLYYRKSFQTNDKLYQCTGISLYSAFLEIAVNNLSIQPGQKSEAYLESRSTKVKQTGAADAWVQTAGFVITAYGELNLRMRSGQIVRMSNPIILYGEVKDGKFIGDHFQPKSNERGELTIEYLPCIPRVSKKIYGSYVAIHLPNNGIDFKWMLEDDIERLKGYSIRQNKGTANALYTSTDGGIDPGFLSTKTIKHAMAAYTKLRIGEFVSFEGEIEDVEASAAFTAETNNQPAPAPEGVVVFTDDNEF